MANYSEKLDKRYYRNRYTAYIDILGYSAIVKKHEDDFFDNVHKAITRALSCIKITGIFLSTILSKVAIGYRIFSDNVLIYTDVSEDMQINTINLLTLIYCVKKIQLILAIDAQVLTRGAITKGKIYAHTNYIYGSGLIDVVEAEKKAKMPIVEIRNDVSQDISNSFFDINEKTAFFSKKLHSDEFTKLLNDFNKEEDYFFFDQMYDLKNAYLLFTEPNNLNDWERRTKAVDELNKFFCDIKNSTTIFFHEKLFLDFLDANIYNVKKWEYIKTHKETLHKQLNYAKEENNYEEKLKEKYWFLIDYHNHAANTIKHEIDNQSTFYNRNLDSLLSKTDDKMKEIFSKYRGNICTLEKDFQFDISELQNEIWRI